MTSEEFNGHLMSALHGPQAEEIVARILEVANPGLGESIAEIAVGAATMAVGDLDQTVWALSVIAIADSIKVRPREGMAHIETRGAAREILRELFVKSMSDLPESRRTLEALRLEVKP